MERWKEDLLPLLPNPIAEVLAAVENEDTLTEIHLRADLPMQLTFTDHDRLIYGPGRKPVLTSWDCEMLLAGLCQHAVYAWETELANGFFTINGGYRVGIAGRTIRDAAGQYRYAVITGFCIRIVREMKNAAIPLVPWVTGNGRILSTLLLSPPGCGKTTVLRDLIRIVSDGLCGILPQRVCVADERFELCGKYDGERRFDLGNRTDVICGMKKADALERMQAALSPQVMATDELIEKQDMDAIRHAKGSGVTILSTVHAGTLNDVKQKEVMRQMLADHVFDRYVLLSDRPNPGTVSSVWDTNGDLWTENTAT
ncbi:MAG: hypothetical protein IJ138_00605 [Clostridia bacterium]|nr:hypothetical protein [Clostridia bacterium]